jgi:hypothetical protein
MSETLSTHPSKAGRRWLDITLRVLVGGLMLLAAVALLVDLSGIVGVWTVRGPAINNVNDVTARVTQALTRVDNGLSRVNGQVQNARQAVTQVKTAAANVGDRLQGNGPVATQIRQVVDNTLSPRIDQARTTANNIHDAAVTVNSALAVLDRIPSISVPQLSDELASISDRAQEAQATVQDLRVRLADIKAGLVTKPEAAITELTSRADARLVQVQTLVNKYRAAVTNRQERVSMTSQRIITMINLLTVTLTLLFLIFAAGLVLLIFFCWQYVRSGRFPSLRVSITS